MVNSGGATAMETVRNYKMIYFTKTAWLTIILQNPSRNIAGSNHPMKAISINCLLKIMSVKKLLLASIFFASCYTKTQKPDYAFMHTVKQQAALDATKRTTIEIIPKKYFFGYRKNSEKLKGFFYVKNVGKINFNLISISPDCDCIVTDSNSQYILPNDSIKIGYQINIKNKRGLIRNSIVAIGNCQFGNQTFYIEGTIINQ